ncbi:siderophore-interacting protein [Amycolatopsis sp. NPDC059090]|uniref:siderophore-interacting protein n=1 Tax=unclassified Amycolatopsis TaxID=2618356 RepID=UPI003670D02A
MAGGMMGKYVSGRVESVDRIARRMRRILISGPELRDVPWTPGQQVGVRVGEPGRGPVRTYSLWDRRDDTVELCVLDHSGNGPGARWSRSARPGQEVVFSKPEGKLVPHSAPYHVFVGEETAMVAFGPMLRALPEGSGVFGVLEVDHPDDRLPLGERITWRYRDGAPAAASAALVAAVGDLDLPAEPGVAYVAGEVRTVQAARKHFVKDRGWPRRSVVTKPFWMPGREGMD